MEGIYEFYGGSDVHGYVIKEDGRVFLYILWDWEANLPEKVGTFVENVSKEFHVVYEIDILENEKGGTDVFKFDKNGDLVRINSWLPNETRGKDRTDSSDLFKKVKQLGDTIIENYHIPLSEETIDLTNFDFDSGEELPEGKEVNLQGNISLGELKENFEKLNLDWQQMCETGGNVAPWHEESMSEEGCVEVTCHECSGSNFTGVLLKAISRVLEGPIMGEYSLRFTCSHCAEDMELFFKHICQHCGEELSRNLLETLISLIRVQTKSKVEDTEAVRVVDIECSNCHQKTEWLPSTSPPTYQ